MRTHLTATLGKITKKNCAYDEPENHTSELKEKRKGEIERERRKEGEKVKERKLAMVALLVFIFV